MASRAKMARAQAQKASHAALSARSNPLVQHIVEDEQFRENVRTAFEAARDAYERMANGKGPAKALVDDKKVQRDIKQAVESLRDAAEQLRKKPRRRKKRMRRRLLIVVTGVALVLVLSEGARKACLDKLFGSEEEFEYTSTTTPT